MFNFSDEDWQRPHGFTVVSDRCRSVWRSDCMYWEDFSLETGRKIGIRCPDHERALADPGYVAVRALLHRKLSSPRKHLRLVKPSS